MSQEDIDEHKWLIKVQNKIRTLVSNPKWDYIQLSDLQLGILSSVMNAKRVNQLSPSINERVVEVLFGIIKKQFANIKLEKGR